MLSAHMKNKILEIAHSFVSHNNFFKRDKRLQKIIERIIIHQNRNYTEQDDQYDHYKDQYWNDLHPVQQYINENATGNKDIIWQIDLLERFKQHLPFKNVLVIGCGNGWVERQLYDLGIGVHFDAFDISQKYLDQAKKLDQDRNIHYFKADINHLDNLGESKYDAIFNVGVLHHTFRLSRAVWKLAKSLKPDGLIFNFDYIGPPRNQYSDQHLLVLKEINSKLPTRFQSRHKLRPAKKDFELGDPTEAIHSDLVRSTVEQFFDIIYQRDLNGGIAYQILWNNTNEFMKNDEEATKNLEFLIKKDKEITETRKIPVLFWYGVGSPKSKDRIANWEILPP